MQIERFTREHALWSAFVAQMDEEQMSRWVLKADGDLSSDVFALGAVQGGVVVGHITVIKQPIIIPATAWSDNQKTTLTDETGEPVYEMYVQTFSVSETARRQGVGSALQRAALNLAREEGCHQLRSWSSLDRPANYVLKLKLGFAAHPAVQVAGNGQAISGVYFVRCVAEN